MTRVPRTGSTIRSQRRAGSGHAAICRGLTRGVCVALTIIILAVQTPATAMVLSGVASGWGAVLRPASVGWAHSLGSLLGAQGGRPVARQETQRERNARVTRLSVSPGQASLRVGERVRFAAIAYDRFDAPTGGVKIKWRAEQAETGRRVKVSPTGEFEPRVAGTYAIIAEGAGHKAQAMVTVADAPTERQGEAPREVKAVSTRDLPARAEPQSISKLSQKKRSPARERGGHAFVKTSYSRTQPVAPPPAAPALLINDQWDQDNYMFADDPGNWRGDPPGSSEDDGAGSGNFQAAAPVLGLPGRGIDISLALIYNSRVWTRAGADITYDIDRDWPAPGWSLGFGKIVGMNTGGSMIVDPDGTRHPFQGQVSSYPYWTSFSGHTADGSFIDYATSSYNGVATYGWARQPNGTQITYGAPGGGAIYPTSIEDANGNYLTITYRNNQGPRIETITDTLGRVVSFHYDQNELLTAVTAPSYGGGPARTLARLHYRQITLSYGFAGLTPRVRDHYPWVIDAVYYPATGSGYWFGDPDSYSSYGMLAKVSERRAMGFSAGTLGEQGTVTSAGQVTQEAIYNYPLSPDYTLTDAPTYTTRTQTWDGMDDGPAVTTYDIQQNAIPRRTEVTQPDGTKSIQFSFNAPGQWNDGLIYRDETRDPANNLLQSSSVNWEPGAYDSPRPSRMEATNERGHVTGTEINYHALYNRVAEVRNYGYGYVYESASNTLLRRTVTEYHQGAVYTNRHILSMPTAVEVYDGAGVRVSRAEYQYDGQVLSNAPNAAQHNPTHDPYAETTEQCNLVQVERCNQWWGCWWDWEYECHPYNPYDPSTDYRGNVTEVKTYADAQNLTGEVAEQRRYDITGNLITASTSCCEQTSFTYTVNTQYAYPTSQTRGAADPNSPARVTASGAYDFNTGLATASTDASGRTSTTSHYAATLRPWRETLPTGAYTEFSYDDTAMTVAKSSYLAPGEGGGVADHGVTYLNGLGLTRRAEALGAGGVWDKVETRYDRMGRVWKQTKPYRNGETQQWGENTYDALGRVIIARAPDGSLAKAFFNEPVNRPDVVADGPGETTRSVDAWGRERWGRTDALGRLIEVVEPNPEGNGTTQTNGLLTTYAYDALGNLTDVFQGAQHRRFRYDSLGRLMRQKLAEVTATLNDAGQYVGGGGAGAQWGDAFAYDLRSNLVSRTDARGVTTTFSYNSDPLNRLQQVSYTTGAQHDTSSPIAPAATVTYEYMTGGDVTRVWKVRAAGVSTDEYGYDSEGRVNAETVTLDSRPAHPLRTDYSFDTLGRVRDVTYPARYAVGAINPTRRVVHHDYDVTSRVSGLKVGGADYASQINYNAASQTTSLKVGAGAYQVTESYGYDPQTGLLSEQRIYRGSDPGQNRLLHLSYDYLRTGTSEGRTGQLTKTTNHLNAGRGRSYTYDHLGRLARAAGGDPSSSPLWTQDYSYDQYGNRKGVVAAGSQAAKIEAPAEPRVSLPHVEVAANALPALPETGREASAGRTVTDGPDKAPLYALPGRSMSPGAALLAAPANAAVTATAGAQVSLNWTAPAGAVAFYEVERAQNAAGPFTVVGTSAGTSYQDTSVTAGAAYLYRVRAVSGGGGRSPASNAALGVAITFTDDPLTTGVTTVKAQHLQELRQAVNAVRGVAGLTAATWTDASLTSVVIKAAHIQELRDRLNEALSALSISVSPFTDPTLTVGGTLIRRVHVEELRQRASRGSGAGGGGPVTVPLDGHDSLTYDTATNRINSAGWGYDAAGNQIRTRTASGAWQRMEYDAAGRLVAVKSDAGVVISSYTYGNSNARLITHEGGSRTYYLWGGPGVLAEYLEADGTASANSPQWSKSYVYLGGRLLATEQPNGANDFVEYHHPDRLGTRIVTNNLSTNFYEQAALPYGTALDGESMGATNRRFTSYDRSSVTGLDYAVNRYYDSQQGRFTTVDPIGTGAATVEDPQSWNMYSYVGNDPINAVDPDGLFLKKLFKGIWKGIKAIGKVLSNRFVQIAIAIALTVITLGLAGPTVGFTFAAGEVSRNLTWLGVTQYVLGGALAAGAVARHVQDQGKGQDPEPPGTDVGGCGTIDNPCPIGTVNVSIVSRRTMIALIAGSGVLGAMAFTTLVAPKQALAIRKCFNNNRFSALAAGSRYHSFFKFIEVGPPISLASDVAATLAKAAGPQMGTQPYASGLNYGIRRLSDGVGSLFGRGARRSVLRALRPIGDRATFPLAVTGAFTLGYNTSIAVQCLTGVIE